MLDSEQKYVVWSGLEFEDEDSPEPGEQRYRVWAGGGFSVPSVRNTLSRLVLARHAEGQYTARQVIGWFNDDETSEALLELAEEELVTPAGDLWLKDAPEETQRAWLLERHERQDFLEGMGEEARDETREAEELCWVLSPLLPSWASIETGTYSDAGAWANGDGAWQALVVGDDHDASELWEAVAAPLEAFLRSLEPSVPPAQ